MKRLLFLLLTCSLFSCSRVKVQAQLPPSTSPKYEFRAVWVATVDNIDWPSKKGIPVDQQKAEFIRLLDMHKANGMNTIIMQIRPAADAFYPSQYEPWSEFLNGTQGLPPSPYYDPLQFMLDETHKRGMEFHAWLNPYRAVFQIGKSSIAPTHITRLHPDWFLNYGGVKYFDPSNTEAQAHVLRVVKDIVSRYAIDGVHMDDYFYPYRIAGREFPDQASYEKFGNGLSKDDWRRSNCDTIIKRLHETIKSVNPKMKFGISPFGVWRNQSKDPEGSATKAGQTNYDDLYADILLWLKKGWIDYVAPQLYWEIGFAVADYTVLLKWWAYHSYGKQVYIGHGAYRAGTTAAWKNPNEIPAQIRALRNNPNVQGSIYFSSKTFDKNPNGWNDSLRNNYYRIPAIVPPMAWLDNVKPARPVINNAQVKYAGNNFSLGIKNKTNNIRNYAVYYSPDNNIDVSNPNYLLTIIPAAVLETTTIQLPAMMIKANGYLKITAISNTNVESDPEELILYK
ncbi:MAG: glycoside hydrolase [Chitinophagaceae bacterium]|nr:glycoside hydrolase [Chitinophagaceae bacterium]